MSYIIDFLKKILLKHDIEIAEFQSILAKSLCGILLIFGTPAHTVGYNTLSKAINIYVLGVVLSSVAFIYFFGLVKGNRRIRSVTSFISCIIWAFITVATAFKHDLLMVLSFTFALSSALIYLWQYLKQSIGSSATITLIMEHQALEYGLVLQLDLEKVRVHKHQKRLLHRQ